MTVAGVREFDPSILLDFVSLKDEHPVFDALIEDWGFDPLIEYGSLFDIGMLEITTPADLATRLEKIHGNRKPKM